MVVVYRDADNKIAYMDGLTKDSFNTEDETLQSAIKGDLLETVFINGEIVRNQTLNEIRNLIHAENGGF